MAEKKTIRELTRPYHEWTGSPINIGVVDATSFDFEPDLITLIRQDSFHGLHSEEAIRHLISFGQWCSLVRIDGVPDETIKLFLFPFSLKDAAKSWLFSHPANTFSTWEQLSQAFLDRYVSTYKCVEIKRSQLDMASQPQPLPTTLPETDTNDEDFFEMMRASMMQLLSSDCTLMSQMKQVMTTQKYQNIRLQNLENRVENIENLVLPMFSNVCGFNPGNFRPEHSVYRPPPDYNYQQPMDSNPLPDYNPYPKQYHYHTPNPPPQLSDILSALQDRLTLS